MSFSFFSTDIVTVSFLERYIHMMRSFFCFVSCFLKKLRTREAEKVRIVKQEWDRADQQRGLLSP